MPKVVQFLGNSFNLDETPARGHADRWCCNNPLRGFRKVRRLHLDPDWTHWFNLHSTHHMKTTYPRGYRWYQEQDEFRPIYLRDVDPTIPGSVRFPRDEIQQFFGGPQLGSPGRYFTCTLSWQLAFVRFLGIYERVELWGYALGDRKPTNVPNGGWQTERECFWYWCNRLRDDGIEIIYQKELAALPNEPGDPATYTGPLYGYETT